MKIKELYFNLRERQHDEPTFHHTLNMRRQAQPRKRHLRHKHAPHEPKQLQRDSRPDQ